MIPFLLISSVYSSEASAIAGVASWYFRGSSKTFKFWSDTSTITDISTGFEDFWSSF